MREFPSVPSREQYESADLNMQAAQQEYDNTRDLLKDFKFPFPGTDITEEQRLENSQAFMEPFNRQREAEFRLEKLKSGGPYMQAKKTNPEVMFAITREEAQRINDELGKLMEQHGAESPEVRAFIESLDETRPAE
jgi:hypothetical protein